MATVAPPARTDIAGTPSNAVAKTAFGVLHDYLLNLLGSAGSPAAARTALEGTTIGQALFTTASEGAARTTLEVSSTTEMGTAITTALDTPVVAATISASQTITTSTWTKVNFDTVTVNKIGTFSTANKRWTPGVIGTVRISASFGFSTSVAASWVILAVFKNGTVLKRLDEIAGTNLTGITKGTAIVETNETDYFEIYAFITATTPTISGVSSSAFDCEYIRS